VAAPPRLRESSAGFGQKKTRPDLVMYEGGKIVIPKVTPEDKNQLTTWYTEHAVKFIEQKDQGSVEGRWDDRIAGHGSRSGLV